MRYLLSESDTDLLQFFQQTHTRLHDVGTRLAAIEQMLESTGDSVAAQVELVRMEVQIMRDLVATERHVWRTQSPGHDRIQGAFLNALASLLGGALAIVLTKFLG